MKKSLFLRMCMLTYETDKEQSSQKLSMLCAPKNTQSKSVKMFTWKR